jgi:hypothetical protein
MLLRLCGVFLFGFFGFTMFAQEQSQLRLAHRRSQFEFIVGAPYELVAPLFGADKEKVWAEGWDPHFIHPQPARDEPGAVFTVHNGHSSVWINTIYDLQTGHFQYAYFVAETMVTWIDIHVQRLTTSSTKVDVVYERTAIQPTANEHVEQLADHDQTQGPEWESALQNYIHRENANRSSH